LPVVRSTYHYRSRRVGQAHLIERIRKIAATRVRYGYRRIHVLLRREGWINPKRVYRLDREMGLQLRNKTPKRRVKAKLRNDRQSATQPNETWAMDFVHDQLATGRKLRVLTIIDTFSRFSPAIEPRFNFHGPDVVEILQEVGRHYERCRRRADGRAQWRYRSLTSVMSSCKCIHDPAPDARSAPANEAVVAGGIGPKLCGRSRHGAPDRKTQKCRSGRDDRSPVECRAACLAASTQWQPTLGQ
jgi:hypothetical protein